MATMTSRCNSSIKSGFSNTSEGKESQVPDAMRWSIEEVGEWIESLGYPQYKECFTANFVTGKDLILIDCSHLPQLGITDWEHMKTISGAVREILGVQEPVFERSIAQPRNEPLALYLEQKSFTGPINDNLTYETFYLKKNFLMNKY